MFNRFRLIHPCDGQADERAIAYTHYSIHAVALKKGGSYGSMITKAAIEK